MLNTNQGDAKMKIKVKDHPHWAGTSFQVNINGKKFPTERGVWYQPVGETDDEKTNVQQTEKRDQHRTREQEDDSIATYSYHYSE